MIHAHTATEGISLTKRSLIWATVATLGLAALGCKTESKPTSTVAPAEEKREATDNAAPAPMALAPHAKSGGAIEPGRTGGLARPEPAQANTEDYARTNETGFKAVKSDPLSTFSIDTDTASYSNVRRFLKQGRRPPKDAVRLEELVNYFSYAYPPPSGAHPFSAIVEVANCPWNSAHLLARVGLKGKVVAAEDRRPANLVFLLDVSGSMNAENKLPLLKRSLSFAVNQLKERDRVAIVVYAGASGLVLPSTPFTDRERIIEAISTLKPGGSTNAGEGINLAYDIAQKNFIEGGINRVILATDGDFNVGITDKGSLIDVVKTKAKQNVFLTVLGLGMGNLKDDMLEKLADHGNGSYAYIDDFAEAQKVFGTQIGGTLETIAKDVKIQVEFNPTKVEAYRLLGYENRRLAAEDFRNDSKDAGEIGAGHSVTAFYEIVPPGSPLGLPPKKAPELKYQQAVTTPVAAGSDLMTVKIRYKQPTGTEGIEGQFLVAAASKPFEQASPDFRFAASVAAFGLLLSESEHKGNASFPTVASWAEASKGADPFGHRTKCIGLVRAAQTAKAAPGTTSNNGEPCNCPPGDPLCSCL